jgi:hypothetical protein
LNRMKLKNIMKKYKPHILFAIVVIFLIYVFIRNIKLENFTVAKQSVPVTIKFSEITMLTKPENREMTSDELDNVSYKIVIYTRTGSNSYEEALTRENLRYSDSGHTFPIEIEDTETNFKVDIFAKLDDKQTSYPTNASSTEYTEEIPNEVLTNITYELPMVENVSIQVQNDYTVEHNKDTPDASIGTFRHVYSLDLAKEKCTNEDACKHFTYNEEADTVQLYRRPRGGSLRAGDKTFYTKT